MSIRRAFIALLILLCISCANRKNLCFNNGIKLGLVVHVTNKTQATMAFLERQVAAANYATRGAIFVFIADIIIDTRESNDKKINDVNKYTSHKERFDIAQIDKRGVHVYIAKIDTTNFRNEHIVGYHIRAPYNVCRSIVVVKSPDKNASINAHPTTLAHELGHMFGLTHTYRRATHNVMTPGIRAKKSVFTRRQLTVLRLNIASWKRLCIMT